MAMSAFRRTASQETKQKSGKGGKSSFYEKLNIPKGTPTPILVRHGHFEDPNPPQDLIEIDFSTGRAKPVVNDFYKGKKHTRKLLINNKEEYRDEPCSAGSDPHNPQPCVGCSAMDQGDKSIGIKDFYAFGVIHLVPYHTHPLTDKTTRQIVMKQDNSGPVTVFKECEGRTCNFCRVQRGEQPIVQQGMDWPGFQANQITTTFGHRRYIEIGKSHLSDLDGFENSISSICANPQCGNQLTTDGYACPNCNTMVIDMGSDPRNDQQINEAVMHPYPCLTCQRPVLLREIVSCEFCEAAGRQFKQISLFDSVIYVFRQGEKTGSHIMMQRHVPIDAFGEQLIQMGWLRDNTGQTKSIHQLVEEIDKPYNFAELFKPRSLEDQAKRLSLRPMTQPQSMYGAQPMYGQPAHGQGMPQPQPSPMAGGLPPPPGYVPSQQTGFIPPPQFQQPGYSAYPTQQPQQQNNTGPAPFQPAPRPNFGS